MSLLEYTAPAPPPPPACPSCRAFVPECLVPAEAFGNDGPPVPMCWLCAHAVTDHGAGLVNAHAVAAACSCAREDILPDHVRARRLASSPGYVEPAAEATPPETLSKAARIQAQRRSAASHTAAARAVNLAPRRR